MTLKANVIFKVLLNHYHKGSFDEVIDFLPESEAVRIRKIETSSSDLSPVLIETKDFLQKIHYSWMKKYFENLPKQLVPFYLSSLPLNQQGKLSTLLNINPYGKTFSPIIKKFFVNKICHSILDQEVLPVKYLPSNALNVLAKFKREELLEIIDFLGLFDLAESIRKIVDRRYLLKIYSCLNSKKQHFLRSCLSYQKKVISMGLDLKEWKGDCQQLKTILHKRGLFRLGIAISDENPHLIWHICHHLDTGRASIISKYIQKKKASDISSVLIQQVINVINFLKQKL